jgi:dolichyl-phosphate-mannose--protein O-mannosyl transferase
MRSPCLDILSFVLVVITLSLCILETNAQQEAITCGSVVKLIHSDSGYHLHSHPIAWGSGSGQQSVTATQDKNSAGSLWVVKESTTQPISCEIGQPIQCNSPIRLEHAQTGKNLHSHLFRAALSGNQEVSAFGEIGSGDTGDNWIIRCDSNSEKFWRRNQVVHFEHTDTRKFLYATANAKFNHQNCGQGCPIMGQLEMSAAQYRSQATKFRTGQGVYFPTQVKDNDEL